MRGCPIIYFSILKFMLQKKLQILILAGGGGSRLWPLSRQNSPKQFQNLVQKKTLFELAIKRARKIVPWPQIFVATQKRFLNLAQQQAPKLPTKNFLPEPSCRDTAAALGLAAQILAQREPQSTIAVFYADHLIQDEQALKRKVLAAAEVVEHQDKFAIIEIESQFPATQFGWVKIGRKLTQIQQEPVYALDQFKEKPALKQAQIFHRNKNYLWNTGLYVFQPQTLLRALQKYLPQTSQHLQKLQRNFQNKKLVAQEYAACPKISLDFGVMEKLPKKQIVILPAQLGWSDVGTFASLFAELPKDKKNVTNTNLLTAASQGNFVQVVGKQKKLVALLGCQDLVVVDTPDVLLVCPQNRSAELKKLTGKLKDSSRFL